MKNEIALTPRHIASVSGGKDSLFMLKYIIEHPTEYPLDEVVYFDLEIDFPFIKDVIEIIKAECVKLHIPFTAIKPTHTWEELYEKYLYPIRTARWCNSKYKLSCQKQFETMQLNAGFKAIWYIGYCADETKRFGKRNKPNEIYPLVDIGMNESTILEWARNQPIYNNYYKTNDRCGCMGCPMSTYINWAYIYKYYPNEFKYFTDKMIYTEKIRTEQYGKPFSVISSNPKYNTEYLIHIIETKWLKKLNKKEGDI